MSTEESSFTKFTVCLRMFGAFGASRLLILTLEFMPPACIWNPFLVNGGLVMSSCSSILDLKPAPDPPLFPYLPMVFYRISFANITLNPSRGGGVSSVLKVFSSIVLIHFWDVKVPSKATNRPIFGSPSSLNGDGCMPPVAAVINLMLIQKMICNHLRVHELIFIHNPTALEFPT